MGSSPLAATSPPLPQPYEGYRQGAHQATTLATFGLKAKQAFRLRPAGCPLPACFPGAPFQCKFVGKTAKHDNNNPMPTNPANQQAKANALHGRSCLNHLQVVWPGYPGVNQYPSAIDYNCRSDHEAFPPTLRRSTARSHAATLAPRPLAKEEPHSQPPLAVPSKYHRIEVGLITRGEH